MYRLSNRKTRLTYCSGQFFIQCHGSEGLWIEWRFIDSLSKCSPGYWKYTEPNGSHKFSVLCIYPYLFMVAAYLHLFGAVLSRPNSSAMKYHTGIHTHTHTHTHARARARARRGTHTMHYIHLHVHAVVCCSLVYLIFAGRQRDMTEYLRSVPHTEWV